MHILTPSFIMNGIQDGLTRRFFHSYILPI